MLNDEIREKARVIAVHVKAMQIKDFWLMKEGGEKICSQ